MNLKNSTIASWVSHGKGLYLMIAAAFFMMAADMMAQTNYQISLRQRRMGDQIGVEVWAKKMSSSAPRIGNMSVAVTYNTSFLSPADPSLYTLGTTDSVDYNVNQTSTLPWREITSDYNGINGYSSLSAQATNNGSIFVYQLDINSVVPNTQGIDAVEDGRGSFVGRLVFDITNHATLADTDNTGIDINAATNVGDFRIFDVNGNNIEATTALGATSSMTIRGLTILNPNGPNEAVNRNREYPSLSVPGYPIYFERSGLITPDIASEYGTNVLAYAIDYSTNNGTSWSDEVIRFAEHRESSADLTTANEFDYHISDVADQLVTSTGTTAGFYVTRGDGTQLPVPTGDGYGGIIRIIWESDPFFAPRSEQALLRIKQLSTTGRTADIDNRTKPTANPFDISDAAFVLSRLFFLQLDGTTNFLRTRDNFSTPTNFTVEAWINPNSFTTVEGAEPGILATGPGAQAPEIEGAWTLYLHEGKYPAFRVRELIGGPGRGENGGPYLATLIAYDSLTTTSDASPINANAGHPENWYHIAAVVENNVARLYVDGELVAEKTNSNAVDIRAFTGNHPVWVGVNPLGGLNAGDYLHAGIKEVKVWRKALTSGGIRSYIMGVDNPSTVTVGSDKTALELYYSFDGAANDLASAATTDGVSQNGSQQNGANPIYFYNDSDIIGGIAEIPEERYPYRPDRAHIKITAPGKGSGVINREGETYAVRWAAFGIGTPETNNTDDIAIEFSRDGGTQWAFAIDNQTPAQLIQNVDVETSTINWEPFESATVAGQYNDLQGLLPTAQNYNKSVKLRIRGVSINNQNDIKDESELFRVAPYFSLRNTGNSIVTIPAGTSMNLLGGVAMMEAWIKPYRFPTADEVSFPILVKKDSTVENGGHYAFRLLRTGQLQLEITKNDGTVVTAVSAEDDLIEIPNAVNQDSVWSHVAVWMNLNNGVGASNVRFYVDGKLHNSSTMSQQLGNNVAVNSNNTSTAFIGYEPMYSDPSSTVTIAGNSFIGELKGVRYWNGAPGGSSVSGAEPTELTNFIRGAMTVEAKELLTSYRANLVAAFDFNGGSLRSNSYPHSSVYSVFDTEDSLYAQIVRNNGLEFWGTQPYMKLVEPKLKQSLANTTTNAFVRWVGFHYDRQNFETGNSITIKDSDLEYSTSGGGNTEMSPYNATASDNTVATFTDAFSLPLTSTYRFFGTNPPLSQYAGTLNISTAKNDAGVQTPIAATKSNARLRMSGRVSLNSASPVEYTSYKYLRTEGPVFTITPASNFTVRALLEGYHNGSATAFSGVLGSSFEENGFKISLYSNNSGQPGNLIATSVSTNDYSDKDPLSGLGVRGTDGSLFGNVNFVFDSIPNADYFVVIEHQNHLPIMSRYAAPFLFEGDDLATWAIEAGWDFQNWGGTAGDVISAVNAATRPLPTITDDYTAAGNSETDNALTEYGNTGLRYNDGQDGTTAAPLAAMVAGDVQRDGQINSADRVKVRVNAGGTDMSNDVTGDGIINNVDRDITDRNTGITTSLEEFFPTMFSSVRNNETPFSIISPLDEDMSERMNARAIAKNNGEYDKYNFTFKANNNTAQAGVGTSYNVFAETSINDDQTKVEVAIYVQNVGEPFAPGNCTFAINYESSKLNFSGIKAIEESPWNNRNDMGYSQIYSAPTVNTVNPVSDLRTLEIDYDSYAKLPGFNVPYNRTLVGIMVFDVREPAAKTFAFKWDRSKGVLRTDGKNVTGDGKWHTIESIGSERFAQITSPNGGETWKTGKSYTIAWTKPSANQNVFAEYTIDGGSTWIRVNEIPMSILDAKYEWITPSINSTECLVRLVNATSGVEIDRTNNYFSILPYENYITKPASSDPVYFAGKTAEINWVVEEPTQLVFYFSADGINNWKPVTAQVNSQNATVNFVVPSNVNTKSAVIAMFDAATNKFLAASEPFRVLSGSMNITNPRGGENFLPGDKTAIRWNAANVANFDLQLSKDNGASWITIENNVNALKTSQNWVVPNVKADFAIIRAIWNGDNAMEYGRSGVFAIDGNGGTDVETGDSFVFSVGEPYPNPFNGVTTINVSLPTNEKVTVEVFSATGLKVATLANNQMMNAGKYNFEFDGSDIPSGVYYIKVASGINNEVREVVLNK